ICSGYGANGDVQYVRGYPALRNDPGTAEQVREVAKQIFTSARTKVVAPLMIGEDFAYYTQKIPGAFFLVGAGNPDIQAIYPHHHPKFDADERAMLDTAKMFVSLVIQ